MKSYTFFLDNISVNEFFKPIRSRSHAIERTLRALKLMGLNPKIPKTSIKGELRLYIDKMNRIFFYTENKYFTLNFPFSVQGTINEMKFYSDYLGVIDNKKSSDLLALINSGVQNEECIDAFYDKFCDVVEYNVEIWNEFRRLIQLEDGYIRYDHDPINEDNDIHPLNHLDIFYSQSSTIKIGLKNKFSKDELIDSVNIKTNCKYLY